MFIFISIVYGLFHRGLILKLKPRRLQNDFNLNPAAHTLNNRRCDVAVCLHHELSNEYYYNIKPRLKIGIGALIVHPDLFFYFTTPYLIVLIRT